MLAVRINELGYVLPPVDAEGDKMTDRPSVVTAAAAAVLLLLLLLLELLLQFFCCCCCEIKAKRSRRERGGRRF